MIFLVAIMLGGVVACLLLESDGEQARERRREWEHKP